MNSEEARSELKGQGWSLAINLFGSLTFARDVTVVLRVGVPEGLLEELIGWTAEAIDWFSRRISDDRLGMPLWKALTQVPFPENLDSASRDWLANAPFAALKRFYPWTHMFARRAVLVGVCRANPGFMALGDFREGRFENVFAEMCALDPGEDIDLDQWLANRLEAN
jgi:hypothetical protein